MGISHCDTNLPQDAFPIERPGCLASKWEKSSHFRNPGQEQSGSIHGSCCSTHLRVVHRRNSKRPRTSQAFSCAGLKQPLQMPSNKIVEFGQLVGSVRESLKGLSNRRSAENGPLSSMPEWEAHPTCSQFKRDSFAMSEPFCNHHAPKFRCASPNLPT